MNYDEWFIRHTNFNSLVLFSYLKMLMPTNFADSVHNVTQRKNSLPSFIGSMKISSQPKKKKQKKTNKPNNKQNPSNNITQINRYLPEIIF